MVRLGGLHLVALGLIAPARRSLRRAIILAATGVLAVSGMAFASSVDESIVDATTPTGSVTLAAGATGVITINLSVTGNQVGTATFDVYRNWTLSGGAFTGSNPQTFTVPARAAQDAPTTFSTSGSVIVAADQAAGTFTLGVGAFDITNSNQTGAKLGAGASSSYSVTVSAPSDTTPPVIVPSVSGTLGSNGWYVSDVTVSWSVTDPESTITSTSGCGSTTIASDTAGVTLTCSATSAGGTATASVTIKRDATAPTAVAAAAPDPNENGWNNTDVTVSFSGTDALSGIDACSEDVLLSSEGADQSASGTCTDKAGNVSATATAGGINIDKTSPVVSLVGGPVDGASYYFGFVPAAPSCSASDALSGLDGDCSVGGYSTAVGTHTIMATATDKAGNNASDTATYTVLAWTLNGFYKPVDMAPVWNTVKNGSTVPLKFNVFAGSTELTDPADVQSLLVVQIAAPGGDATTDPVETTATGGTSLRYDATSHQFVYNWQTPKTPGKSYRVTLKTLDGSTISADFLLK